MKTFMIMLLSATAALALQIEEYAQVNFNSDSIVYGEGLRKDITAGLRLTGENWNLVLTEDWATAGEGASLNRFYNSRLESNLAGSVRLGNFRISPDIQLDLDLDSSAVVLPHSEGAGYRNSAVRPAMTLSWSVPQVLEVSGTGRYWVRDVAALDSDTDTEWSEVQYGGQALWHTPLGAYLSVGGFAHNTKLDSYDYNENWSRVDIAAGYTPAKFPAMTFIRAEAEYSLYNGQDYTGMDLPERFTARLRAVQNVARNLTFNVTVSQAADFYEDATAIGPFQGALRTRFKFAGWGNEPSSVTLTGQFTQSAVTTRLGEMEGRVSLYSGLSALITGKLWYGPSSVINTGGYRVREIIGGGLEFRMSNGLNSFVIYEHEASDLNSDKAWGRIRGGIGFYPVSH
ncbi:hypothetical protein CSA37_01105 [Candidatus Fermentibacteria bacterium]|nr:MAG: hypothetical protein CSA37_01105 [Candidatus Fermentibacteria bacterium]